jgi:putative hydrolase of the HAD superfamily
VRRAAEGRHNSTSAMRSSARVSCSTCRNSIAAVPYRDQVLIFDADDTLWEFNHLFERVIDDYLVWLAHPAMSTDDIRTTLLDIESANAAAHGYGTHVFLRSLRDCFLHLNQRVATADEHAAIDALARPLLEHHVTPVPGVVETLSVLGTRHRLLLLTKGATGEQQRKIDASALASHFEHVHIVAEKDVGTYCELIRRHNLDPATTWMIGNSPKSDVLPARAAGMRAVYIPNVNTWALEHADLDGDDDGILHLRAVTELLEHF